MERRNDIFWGVDFSVRAASIGWTVSDGSSRGVITCEWEAGLAGAERLSAASTCIEKTARLLAFERPAAFVYIEQPSGSSRDLPLVYMCGALQLGIHRALFTHWHQAVQITTVPSGTWKKEVLGRGDYRKPKKNDDFEYQALIWCRENGIGVIDDNEADAVCVAEHARLSVKFVTA